MHKVHGRAQHYAWGDPTLIPDLLGEPADGRPWAEWWVGTHHSAPSTVDDGATLQSVAGDLPYMLKLLAAAEPLSLQSHPDSSKAKAGFEREQQLGVPHDSPRRVYSDPFAKPELLCALTPFDTLCGFRSVDATIALLYDLDAGDLAAFLENEKLATVVAALYHSEFDIAPTITTCARRRDPAATLVTSLAKTYPNDPSVVVTLLLNRVVLAPGEAIFLGPGNLHAYLRGFGVEAMGSSDNVVRGGLTVKHVDVDELLDVLDFEPLLDPVVRPVEVASGQWRYDTPNAPFLLSRLQIGGGEQRAHRAAGRQLLLWVDGDRCGECDYLAAGDAIDLHGPATIYCAEEA